MQRVDDWLAEAQAEFCAARDLYKGRHWSWCCFACQQAAEKVLKAVCQYYRSPQFGHNLNHLIGVVAEKSDSADSIRPACGRLNRFYIPTRYPDAFSQGAPVDQFFESDAQQAIGDTKEVIAFALNECAEST